MSRPSLATALLVSFFLPAAGCGGKTNTSTTTTPPASAQLTLSASSLAFNSVTVGQTSPAQTVTLTNSGGVSASITGITLSDTTNYAMTNTCGVSLGVSATCTLSITFTPKSAASLPATISIASTGVGSPQTISLTGTGAAAPAGPALTLSANTLTFPSTPVGQTSATQTLTLTNSGGSPLTLSDTVTGNSADFTSATTCGASLAASGNCTFTLAFVPQATGTRTATITLTDNAANSPQTVSLTGTGASSGSGSTTYKLYVFPATFPAPSEPDASVSALYSLINSAKSTVDMTMYELQDTTFSGDLVADCARGVKVRVILSLSEQSSNTPAYTQLNGAGANCSAVFSNSAFVNTHQKTITVDAATTAILSLNLQTQYYSTTRDFALVENDAADIAAIEATFNADYAAGTPSGGTQGASDFNYMPGGGDTTVYPGGDLIWSPTTATADMLSIINNAKNSILLENEEMSDTSIVDALEAACQHGVTVHIAMVEDSTNAPYSDYSTEWKALEGAGCGVHVYPDTATGLYIHAKAVVADYGLSTQNVYMGSINYSNASLTENRELGLFIADPASVAAIETTMAADYAGGAVY
jgi:cardiolipin synthase